MDKWTERVLFALSREANCCQRIVHAYWNGGLLLSSPWLSQRPNQIWSRLCELVIYLPATG